MCGIVVLHACGGTEVAAAMAATLVHRGPDDAGVARVDRTVLAARRLAVIDVDGGHQPISDETQDVWAALNGEIYNFRELRRTLEGMGRRFRSRSDTEVLVHGYLEWGLEGLLERVRGMFAFAIADARSGRCALARDPLGEKPLYLARVHGGWAAASEIKALFRHPSLSPQLDRSVLGRSLATRYLAGPRTAFANVRRLPPGHYAWIDGASCEVRPYWRPPAPAPLALRAADIPDAVRAHLTTAVARCLVSDVPLGALLSGGLDSSIVVAASRRAGWGSLRTYTVGFDPPHSDERAAARRVAAHFDTVHTEIVVSLDAAALLDDVVWHLDEPMGDAAALPTLLICRAARSQVTVVLSGEGADELFLGYPRYALSRLADHARFLPRPLRRALFATAARLLPGRAATACARLADAPADPLLRSAVWMSGTSPRTVAALCRLPLEGWESWYLGEPDGRPSDSGHTLAAVLEHDLQAWLADDVLLKLDRMSMAASLEARAPFLDRDLVEFVCHLPTDLRFSHRGKAWLRQAFAADLPRASARRPKHPFRPPVAAWMRGRLGIALRDRMSRPGSFTREHLDPGVARNLLLEHQGGADHSLLLWSLLVHEAWWDRFFRHGAGG